MDITHFQETVWQHYRQQGRHLPWREAEPDGHYDAYKILVSEIMLQQTQASRVIPKYYEFLQRFPTVDALAQATLQEVLAIWSGLGYNRRAKFIWQAAQAIAIQHNSKIPESLEELVALPGIGRNTAAAILVYAHNQPLSFIETNIRTVYIYHFFPDGDHVSDAEILELVTQSIDSEHPREWYWALMDYGSHLKATVGNLSRSSKHYVKQSTFKGSNREIRGKILKLLTRRPYKTQELKQTINDERFEKIIDDLVAESLVKQDGPLLTL